MLYFLIFSIEFVIRVFDGDLSETKKEALAKYQQRVSKTQQDWA
jgi:hypothetical protein